MKKLRMIGMLLVCAFCLSSCGGLKDGEVDITLSDIIEANDLAYLLEEHKAIFIREDTVDINGYILDTSYHRFALEDGNVVGDIWHENDENKMIINARNGVIYGLMGEQKHTIIVPKEDYFYRVAKLYPLLPDPKMEELQSAVKQDNEILVTTIRDTFDDGSISKGTEYRLNAKTLAIESVQLTTYNELGQKAGIIGLTVEYDSVEKFDDGAWKSITQPHDGEFCDVTAVIEPGTDREEVHKIQVAHDCDVEVAGKSSYDIYSDETCHMPLSMVDTDSDNVTFYAKAVE